MRRARGSSDRMAMGRRRLELRPQAGGLSFIVPRIAAAGPGPVSLRRAHRPRRCLRAATKAAKMFLDRRLFRRKSTDAIIDKRFLEFHYPYHWRYNLLHGLKAMAEACLVADRRCREAIDVLKSKQLPD